MNETAFSFPLYSKKIILIVFGVFSLGYSFAQFSVEGFVIDASSKEPLAFVNIGIIGTQQTTSSSIEGKFKLSSNQLFAEIYFSYVGYEPLKYTIIDNEKSIQIKLHKKSYELNAVEILPEENPAHRIIRLATANRDKNNPAKINAYVCETYSKTYYDFVPNEATPTTKNDSAFKARAAAFSEKSYVLLIESTTERKFLYPENLNEKIIATKVSGFKAPSFSTTATDLQPFSFYEDYFKILGKNYLNPITAGSTKKYLFIIQDTIFKNTDTTFIISFRPFKNKNFDGLEGLLYINSNKYAIQNVIAEPYDKGLIHLKIQQQYSFVENKQWFPEQLNYEMHYKNYPSVYLGMKIIGKSFITNVTLDTVLKKRDFDFKTIVMDDDAANKKESYWQQQRMDTLTQKEKNTYKLIDSVGEVEHLDRTLKFAEALLTLKLPISFVDIDLIKIIGLNKHEKYRLGIGLHTNNKISKWFSVGGYVGYGFKDSILKYGGDLKIKLKKGSDDYFIKYEYIKDIIEPGKTQYFYTTNNFLRNIMTSRMDYLEKHQLNFNFRAIKYFTAALSASTSNRFPKYDYLFLPNENDKTEVITNFKIAELKLQGRYAYKEQLVQSFGQLLSDGTKYPVIYFSYSNGFKMKNYGDYPFNKLSLGIEKSFLVKNFGTTNVLLEGGIVDGNVPYSILFNGNGSYSNNGYVYIDNTFQTMQLYEFVSDRYVNLFASHNFGTLLLKTPKFKPEFVVFANAGFGSLSNPSQHKNTSFKTMEKGYYESGLLINKIIRYNYLNLAYIGIGGGAFMRMGSYAYPKWQDNMAYKISITISL